MKTPRKLPAQLFPAAPQKEPHEETADPRHAKQRDRSLVGQLVVVEDLVIWESLPLCLSCVCLSAVSQLANTKITTPYCCMHTPLQASPHIWRFVKRKAEPTACNSSGSVRSVPGAMPGCVLTNANAPMLNANR